VNLVPHQEYSRRALNTAAACAIGMMVSVVPFHIGTFPLFLGPVSAEFGWGRAAFALSVNISGICAALAAPFVGRMVDRLGARRVLLPAIVLYALATMAQSQLTASKPQFYATYCLLGVSEAIAGPVAFSHLISSTFQMRRGLFLALVIGAAPTISIMCMAPVTHLLIDHYGWRHTYTILGAIILFIGFPAIALLLRDPLRSAAPQARVPGSASASSLPGRTVPQVFATVTFWLILVALVIHSLVVGGVRAHTVALFTDRGISAGIATLAISTFALAGLIGNVSSGFLLDRVNSARVALPFFAAALLGLLILHHAVGTVTALAGIAILGFGIGAESGVGPYFFSRYFGIRSFGTIYGCLVSLLAISSGVGPFLLGRSFDRFGSYGHALGVSEIGLAVGIVLVMLLGPYVYAVRPHAAAWDEDPTPASPDALSGKV
jgi:MFS family permease